MLTFFRLLVLPRAAPIAENLFLRKQLALFQERKVRPRRITRTTRLALMALSRFFDWQAALVIVKPETFVKWHRTAFRIFWKWKSRRLGRPLLPKNLRGLIHEMARENPTWGEERIANELSLKLGILVSPAPSADISTCRRAAGPPGNGGRLSSGTTPRPLLRATSSYQ